MKNIIFIAPPAAGKGTQSEMLKEEYGYVHISTGDMLREAISSGSKLGNEVKNIIDAGNFVSDEIVIDLIKGKLEEIIGKPFILDGFPRTLIQAKSLDDLLRKIKLDYKVIYLELDEEEAMKRIVGRLTCKCGKSYNTFDDNLKPKEENICDFCSQELIKRADDNAESFKIRYDKFLENTKPILRYYEELSNLITIDASSSVSDIFDDISEVVVDD